LSDVNAQTRFSIGLEQGADGGYLAHALDLPGCAAPGETPEAAAEALGATLQQWLRFLAFARERVAEPEEELEIAVDEWIASDARVLLGETSVLFAADVCALDEPSGRKGLRRLGDLRGLLLSALRGRPDSELDRPAPGGMRVRDVLEELARAQWWTLSRLGASPMAEIPAGTLARLDTAMALVVQRLDSLPPERRAQRIELDGEEWTPRKVLRRLLWLEWTLGRTALWALQTPEAA
jgi:predicted RNase H-like HicB family nuclease